MTCTHQADSKFLPYLWLSYLFWVISAGWMFEPVSSGWSMLSHWVMRPFLNTCAVLSWAAEIRVCDLSNTGVSSYLRRDGMVKGVAYLDDEYVTFSSSPNQFTPPLVYYSSLRYLKLVSWRTKKITRLLFKLSWTSCSFLTIKAFQ